jgi:hypothetical protein
MEVASEFFLPNNRACSVYSILMRCPIHSVPLVSYCPACRGSARSKRKTKAARENGKLAGRPKGSANKQTKLTNKRCK